jgi:hypothetical protein
MKARIGILCALVLFASSSYAYAEGYAGFRAGGVRSVFVGDDADVVPWSRVGFTGGGFVGFDSGKYFGFRTDVLYTEKGGQSDDLLFKLDYLELAPLFVARYALGERYGLRAFMGPVFSVWISAEAQQYFDDGMGNDGELDSDIGDIVKHFELSGTIGVEFNAKLGPYVGLLETRYTQGSRVFEDENLDGSPLDFKVSNSGVSVMAGLMVPF